MKISDFNGVFAFLELNDSNSIQFAGKVYPNTYVAIIAATTNSNEIRSTLVDASKEDAISIFNSYIEHNQIDSEEWTSRLIQILCERYSNTEMQNAISIYLEEDDEIQYDEFIDPDGLIGKITKFIGKYGANYQNIMNALIRGR